MKVNIDKKGVPAPEMYQSKKIYLDRRDQAFLFYKDDDGNIELFYFDEEKSPIFRDYDTFLGYSYAPTTPIEAQEVNIKF